MVLFGLATTLVCIKVELDLHNLHILFGSRELYVSAIVTDGPWLSFSRNSSIRGTHRYRQHTAREYPLSYAAKSCARGHNRPVVYVRSIDNAPHRHGSENLNRVWFLKHLHDRLNEIEPTLLNGWWIIPLPDIGLIHTFVVSQSSSQRIRRTSYSLWSEYDRIYRYKADTASSESGHVYQLSFTAWRDHYGRWCSKFYNK